MNRFVVLVLAALLLLTGAASAAAVPRPLDPSFGEGGRVVRASDLGGQPWQTAPTFAAKLTDGRLVVLAGERLHAFERDGSTATSFGGGTVDIPLIRGQQTRFSGIAADSQGRLVVAGSIAPPEGTGPYPQPENVLLVRYTPEGTLDPSFGEGGILITNFGLPPRRTGVELPVGPSPLAVIQSTGVAIDSADRIVLTGARLAAVGPCRGGSGLSYYEAFVARLDGAGRLDPSFNGTGLIRLAGIAKLYPPAIDPTGGLYLLVFSNNPCTELMGPARFVGHLDDSGAVDPGFGKGGWIGLSARRLAKTGPNPTTVDSHGRLLMFNGRYIGDRQIVQVERFLDNGNPDRGFGNGGRATLGTKSGDLQLGQGGVDTAGNIFLAGTYLPLDSSHGGTSFFLGRLTPNGVRASGFGRAGLVRTLFGKGSEAAGGNLVLAGRRATVTGTLRSPLLNNDTGIALAGYRR